MRCCGSRAPRSIVFGDRRYAPDREEGRALLAHELTHTLQQGRAGVPPGGQHLTIEAPDTEAEAEAQSHAAQLAGITKLDTFIDAIQQRALLSTQMVMKAVLGMNAVQVGVVTAAFDGHIANKATYVQEIQRLTDMYQQQVAPIGEVPFMSENFAPEAVWVDDEKSKRLAIVTYHPGFLGLWGNAYWLDSWVDPEMEPLVIAKQKAHRGPDTISRDDLHEAR